jgi:hypothetical protein
MVVLNMAPLAGNPSQAAEIRKGSCASGGTTAFKLNPIQSGQSTTDVAVSRRTLFTGAYAVIVRVGAVNSAVTACVNIGARQDAEGGGPHLHQPTPVPATG